MSAQPIEAVERDDVLQPRHPYRRFLRSATRWQVAVERKVNELVSYEQNPFYFHGALPTFVFWMLIASGIGLLFYYKATLTESYESLVYLAKVPFGNCIRSSHRYSADAMLLAIYLHTFRVYITDRHREYRIVPWLTGVVLLLLTYVAGISGYMLVGDQRSWGLIHQSVQAFQAVPLVGDFLASQVLAGPDITDYTVARALFFHLLSAMAIFWFLWMHLLRIRRPFMIVTIGIGAAVVGVILMVAGLWPAGSYTPVVEPMHVPEAYEIGNWLYLPGFWLLSSAGPLAFWGAVVLLFGGLLMLPYLLRDTRRNIAMVVRDKCVGCQLCAIDCPYSAITMVPTWNERKKKPDLLAVVYPPRCSECGVCIGSCDFDAIELSSMPYRPIEDLVKELAPKREAPAEAAGD
ncbi:MAG: cytochrome b N-terminal domain-containing protein [Fimbriimonadaceae bacterium]|nr:cytochrome b N-terminal domain-containing protein [Fimbriimonadaceae bacterium]